MNTKLKIIFVSLGLFIGILTTSQLITSVPVNSTFLLDQIKAKEEFLKTLSDEQVALQSKIVLLRERISRINDDNKLSQQQGVLDKLQNLKKLVGLDTIKGTGIEISLNDGMKNYREDNEMVSLYLIHAGDLRDIINILRAAGAKGIAINNQRILSTTSIISVGNSILVNNVNLAPPYVLNVAGDQEILLRRLQDTKVLPDLKKRIADKKIKMKIQSKNFLTIPIYNGSFRTKHIKK